MNKLQLPQAKLLYAVSEIYRKRKIDETEKRILKGISPPNQKRSSRTMWKSMSYSSKAKKKRNSSSGSSHWCAPQKSLTRLSLKIRKCWLAWSRRRRLRLGGNSCAARKTTTKTSINTKRMLSRNCSIPKRPNDHSIYPFIHFISRQNACILPSAKAERV